VSDLNAQCSAYKDGFNKQCKRELSFSKAHPQNITPHWNNKRYSNHAERHRHGHTAVCTEFIRVERILLQHIFNNTIPTAQGTKLSQICQGQF